MKNLSYVIVALAVVLGFGSCKKENMLEVNEMRVFSVSADATDGTKAIVTPQGDVEFYDSDHIYLAYKGVNNNSWIKKSNGQKYFTGNMRVPDNIDLGDAPLHFFGLAGVVGPGVQSAYWTEEQLKDGTIRTRTCISLQNLGKNYSDGEWNKLRRSMPYICFGESVEKFNGGGKYTAKLKNKCAMVKYNVAAGIPYSKEIYIEGLNNVVEVEFVVPYYKFNNNMSELKQFTDKGYDEDGFKFICGKGKIQTASLLTPGSDKVSDPKNLTIDGVIIIPYREEPKNEKDKTYCYSLLLPQTEGLDKLSGYYYDDNDNKVDLTIEITKGEGAPNIIKENYYYEIDIKKAVN